MDLTMLVLKDNKQLDIDNTSLEYKKFLEKGREEFKELIKATNAKDKVNMAEETLDLIQVCIGILYRLKQDGVDIRQIFYRHEKKLINRGWKSLKTIVIRVLDL